MREVMGKDSIVKHAHLSNQHFYLWHVSQPPLGSQALRRWILASG